jgi:hypothetical protein
MKKVKYNITYVEIHTPLDDKQTAEAAVKAANNISKFFL